MKLDVIKSYGLSSDTDETRPRAGIICPSSVKHAITDARQKIRAYISKHIHYQQDEAHFALIKARYKPKLTDDRYPRYQATADAISRYERYYEAQLIHELNRYSRFYSTQWKHISTAKICERTSLRSFETTYCECLHSLYVKRFYVCEF